MVHGYQFWYIPVLVYTNFGRVLIMVYTKTGILSYNRK